MARTAAISAAIAVVAGLAVTAGFIRMAGSDDPFADCRTTKIAGGSAAIGGPFTLVDEDGKTVTDKEVLTSPALVYFGYTFCPDICPFDSARNADAVDLLAANGIEVTPVFISVDPKRDTPARLREFTDEIHPGMIGLSGSAEQVKAASQAYRTYFRINDQDDPEFYMVDHSTFTYLVLPETGFVEFFDRETTPETMAEKTACFISANPGV